MRSLFWRIFASFWLAIALVAGLSMLLGRALNQDAWVIGHHPAVSELAELWTQLYEQEGAQTAQNFLEKRKKRYRVDTQVLDDSGRSLVYGTFPPRAAAFEARQDNPQRLPWRRLTEEYVSPSSGQTYLFIYRIPHPELMDWHRQSLFWPLSALAIALVVLTLLSLLLTLSITRPLGRLRGAVLERLCTGATWSEGPVWMHEDASVLWSDIPANRMLRWSPRDGMTVWRNGVDFTGMLSPDRWMPWLEGVDAVVVRLLADALVAPPDQRQRLVRPRLLCGDGHADGGAGAGFQRHLAHRSIDRQSGRARCAELPRTG